MKDTTRNVFIGISLSNKNLSPAAIKHIAHIATQKFDALRIAYLVADEIDLINMRVFEGGSDSKSRQKTDGRALELERLIAENTPPHMKSYTSTYRWVEILNRRYWSLYYKINFLFQESVEFQRDILSVAELYAKRRMVSISAEELRYLANYVMFELPTLIRGVDIGLKHYGGMIYPSYSEESLTHIVDKMWNGCYNFSLDGLERARVYQFELELGDLPFAH